MTPDHLEAIEIARTLIAAGIPVFAAQPALDDRGEWDPAGGTGGTGYVLPAAWQKSVPTASWLDPTARGFESKAWRPGWALCALMGCGLDLLDIDPRHGGDLSRQQLLAEGVWPVAYGAASTPSGGTHEFAASLLTGSRDNVRPGFDVKSGQPDGSGRGFAFIAPTIKISKTTGALEPYRWTNPPDLTGLGVNDDSGEALAAIVRLARGPSATTAPSPAAGDAFASPHTGPILDGQRHAKLLAYAGSLRGRGQPYGEAVTLMERRWQDCAQPPAAGLPSPLVDALATLRDAYSRYPAGESRQVLEDVVEPPAVVEVPSWAPVDLSAVLDGTLVTPVPTLMPRADGKALLYAGLVHSFHGESESGKSLLLQAESARLIAAGQDVLFVDFESDAASVVERLLAFGAAPAAVLAHFHYVRPAADPYRNAGERVAWDELLTRPYALAVIDGVTDALGIFGAETKDNDSITEFNRRVPRRIADKTGAAVALVDHVAKDSDSRGRFAIGGQAKMSALTGAAYVVEVLEVLGRGLRGVIVVRCAKDRPGNVRPYCGPWRKGDRTQEAARIVVDSRTPGATIVTVEAPRIGNEPAAPFRPTALMERASRIVEDAPGLSRNGLTTKMGGKKETAAAAVEVLVLEGYLTRAPGVNNSQQHTAVRPYRQANDSASDVYLAAGPTQAVDRVVSGSGPLTGEPGPTHSVSPGPTRDPLGPTGLTAPSDPFALPSWAGPAVAVRVVPREGFDPLPAAGEAA